MTGLMTHFFWVNNLGSKYSLLHEDQFHNSETRLKQV